jgi:hypothetical protein
MNSSRLSVTLEVSAHHEIVCGFVLGTVDGFDRDLVGPACEGNGRLERVAFFRYDCIDRGGKHDDLVELTFGVASLHHDGLFIGLCRQFAEAQAGGGEIGLDAEGDGGRVGCEVGGLERKQVCPFVQ